MLRPSFRYFYLLFSLGLVSCVMPSGTSTHLFSDRDDPKEDAAYMKAFEANTRGSKVYQNFESKFEVNATHLTPAFREAFNQRLAALYARKIDLFQDNAEKTAFFVSVFSPEKGGMDLHDEAIWTIILEVGSESFSPSLIRTAGQKERWPIFFPFVHPWSKEFLLIFDKKVAPDLPLSEKSQIRLRFLNATAEVRMDF